ncbi:hypothetical protein WJX73_009966 [Symbiochloris irregularis]|uniref:Selenide, water dikinase n=1 Tax=Symbiochloris irregularis TaxID=706552 RepID=A0AAW1NTX4_9CHLO
MLLRLATALQVDSGYIRAPRAFVLLLTGAQRTSARRLTKAFSTTTPSAAMQHTDAFPNLKDLVLLGGGHAHVEVLRSFGMKPLPGVRLTLITKDVHTAYSGMLPGFVSGFYSFDECHIDLSALAAFAGARMVHAEAQAIDTQAQAITLSGRPPMRYDVLSIDVGITPSAQGVPGAMDHAIPVKPVSNFVDRLTTLKSGKRPSDRSVKIAVVGGGAGGVELALAVHHMLEQQRIDAQSASQHPPAVTVFARGQILRSYPAAVRKAFLQAMQAKGMSLEEDAATASTGLPLDEQGFVRVLDTLQCEEGPANVFAVGDVATSAANPRPKAGVFAVRQGPPLASNLRRLLQGEELQPFTPQSTYLSIITTGDRYAVASKGWVTLQGAWLWKVKDWIDRGWMAKYAEKLSDMMQPGDLQSPVASAAGAEALAAVAAARMRCSGCGAKVGSTTVDFLRSFVPDPLVFGAIAANHALGDCHAMGAKADTALAIVVVPQGLDAQVEEDVYQLLAGALPVLEAAGCALVGGHTSEGAELSLGFCINGSVEPSQALKKGGMRPGQALVLTKPLGTGILLAGHMRRLAKGRWLTGAVQSMQQSSEAAARCLRQHGATACTDVTGFGLLGHLTEMARASQVAVRLDGGSVPLLQGARECAEAGVLSSLHPQNARVASAVSNVSAVADHPLWPLLLDPQTAGGLLASLPIEQSEECLRQLHEQGYHEACSIGRVGEACSHEDHCIHLEPSCG